MLFVILLINLDVSPKLQDLVSVRYSVLFAEPVVDSNCQPAPSRAQCLAKRSCQGLCLSTMRMELNGIGCRTDTLTTTESSTLTTVAADENGRESASMVGYKQMLSARIVDG